jgi:hypothetical protein
MLGVAAQSTSYPEDLPVLRDDEADIVGERVLARARGHGHQVVVVDEVVAAESDEHQGLVHELRRLLLADEGAQLLLVLAEVLQLAADTDDVHLHRLRLIEHIWAGRQE